MCQEPLFLMMMTSVRLPTSNDHMSTISIDNSAGHETDGDDDQAIEMNPAGIEAGVEINLGFEAP
jgi:hypothetical protein